MEALGRSLLDPGDHRHPRYVASIAKAIVMRTMLRQQNDVAAAIATSVFFAAAHGPAGSSHSGNASRLLVAVSHALIDAVDQTDGNSLPQSARQ